MKKFKTILMAMVAVFALGAVLAASASAETTLEAKWLTGTGNNIAAGTELESTTTGEITLEDTGAKTAVLCSGFLDGTVSAKGADTVLTVLSLAGVEIKELTGTGLVCTNVKGCTGTIEVWPEGLPWTTTLFLTETGPIQDRITGIFGTGKNEFGYSVLCTVLGINVVDTCTATFATLEVLNDVNGDAETPAGAIALPLANCTVGGAGAGKNETDVLSPITLNNSELLSVSSE